MDILKVRFKHFERVIFEFSTSMIFYCSIMYSNFAIAMV